jgi:AraC-like DNA-binding protein
MMGIQMRPVAFKALFGIPLSEIRDYYLPGSALLYTLNQIEDKIKGKGSFIMKARWLEKLICSRINESAELHVAIDLSRACEKFIRVDSVHADRSIEEMIGYSRTHTFRIFNDWFGVAAHRYQKLIQFVQTIHDIHRGVDKLTRIGLNNGYFDQPHFIRSFRTFAGITPGEYRKRMTPLPGQFSA